MKNINSYIFEKFKISKDIKNVSIEGVHPKYIEIIDIIEDFLSRNKYFGYKPNDFKIKGESGYSISLIIPKDFNISQESINFIGVNITKKILKLKLDWYWSFDKENNKFIWSDSII